MPGKILRRLVQRIEGTMYREMEFRADGIIDEGERTLRAVASTETAVLRRSFFSQPWVEILGHKRGEVNLERLNKNAPVLYNHNMFSRADRIGVVESAKLNTSKRQVEAIIRISKRDDVSDIWDDVRDGILKNLSVGYEINKRVLTKEVKGEPDEFRITSWSPGEISFVPLGADMNAQVGRALGEGMEYRIFDIENERSNNAMFRYDTNGNPLPDTPEARAAILAGTATRKDGSPYVPTDEVRAAIIAQDASPPAATPPAATPPERSASVVELDSAREAGIVEGRQAEQQRVTDINTLFSQFPEQDAIRKAAIDKPDQTIEQTRALLLTALGAGSESVGGDAERIEGGEDAVDKFTRGAGLALMTRAGLPMSDDDKREATANGLRGFTLYEFARRSLTNAGVNADHLGKMELVGRAFTSSDFPLILADVSNKAMLKGWDESPETWQIWCAIGELSDFKQGNRVNLSSFNDLTLVNEDGEYTYGTFTENGANIQLATYGKLFAISRQSIINDDVSAFTRIPSSMGRASGRLVGDLAYGVLFANAALLDGIALFDGTSIGTTHGNLNIGGAAAITAASFDAARVAMGRQSDSSGSATALNIRVAHFLVPMAIESTARVLMASEFDPADGTNNNRAPNPVRGQAQVVSDARLDINDADGWYLAADGNLGDTIEVAFLDGNQAPVLEQQQGWSIDGTEFKVRIDAAAAAMDFRGLQRNDGA